MSSFKPHKACDVNWDKLKFPAWAMYKIDGVRMLNVEGIAVGRSLKKFKNVAITSDYSRPIFTGFDGEATFQGQTTSPSLCRDTTSVVNTINGKSEISWNVFDFVNEDTENLPYSERYERARMLLADIFEYNDLDYDISPNVSVKMIPYEIVNSVKEAQEFYERALLLGFEGAIYRDPLAKHNNGRCTENESAYVLAKPSSDKEALVVSLVEAQENLNEAKTNELGYTERSSHKDNKVGKGMVGSFICKDVTTGNTITVGAGKATHKEREDFWNNPDTIIGKHIKYLSMDTGVKDAPRFARYICIRSEEDMGGD